MFDLLLRDAYGDHVAQEMAIKKSNLDWIIVRPGAFTDGQATGLYKHGFSARENDLTFKISRADVAGFMLRQLTDNTYLHQTPALSYQTGHGAHILGAMAGLAQRPEGQGIVPFGQPLAGVGCQQGVVQIVGHVQPQQFLQ